MKCVIPLYDGHTVPPKEGELRLHRKIPRKSTVGLDRLVWSVDVDESKSPVAQTLRLLWDATDIL
jgi:hypothetical protein